jgi:hypothetical protein
MLPKVVVDQSFNLFCAGVVRGFEAAIVIVFDIILIQGKVLRLHPAL